MKEESSSEITHPAGDRAVVVGPIADGPVIVDTYLGRVKVDWDPEANVTALGHLAFFVEYLKSGGRLDALVADCPLTYTSPNRPEVRNVLGTVMLGVLSGHWRYSHLTSLRGDTVSAELLGMTKIQSEDSVRHGLEKIDETEGDRWLRRHLLETVSVLLSEKWILDCDTTIKPLYGHQQGAVLGFNPHKPGRPSHAYHSFQISSARLILDVVVKPGNESSSKHSEPHIWTLLEQLPRTYWPALVRGDKDWGNERNMARCEQEKLPYLFKLRLTKNVRRAAEKLTRGGGWVDAGKGWEGQETKLRLEGWSRSRRVIMLRRLQADKSDKLISTPQQDGTQDLFWADPKAGAQVWEFAALVTSLDLEILSVAQLYRDRGDSENPFDELKNQWGWAGFTTFDIKRCQIMARMVALVYNWWSLYVRLADPDHHHEALTTRSLLLNAIARQTRHAGQTRLTITSNHGRREHVQRALEGIAKFFKWLAQTAEQLTQPERWALILSQALKKYLRGRKLQPPPSLLPV